MGLQPFEVRFFFVPKSYLIQSSRTRVHKKVLKIRLKPVHDVSNIIKKYFLCVKSRMGKPLDSKFFKSKKLYFQSVFSQAKQELRGNFFKVIYSQAKQELRGSFLFTPTFFPTFQIFFSSSFFPRPFFSPFFSTFFMTFFIHIFFQLFLSFFTPTFFSTFYHFF